MLPLKLLVILLACSALIAGYQKYNNLLHRHYLSLARENLGHFDKKDPSVRFTDPSKWKAENLRHLKLAAENLALADYYEELTGNEEEVKDTEVKLNATFISILNDLSDTETLEIVLTKDKIRRISQRKD